MKKEYSIWISGLSLLLSVIAVCVAVWRSPELSFDYQGVLVGVLSLLVTALVGWNIYTFMDFKEKVRESEYAISVSLTTSLAQLGRMMYGDGNLKNAIPALLNALAAWEGGSGNKLLKESYEYCIKTLKEIKGMNVYMVCTAEDFVAYMNAAKKTGDNEIIDYVKSFKIKEDI